MPWIEPRGNRHRVYWYQDPAAKRGKAYESLAPREQASQFKRLVDALVGDVSAAQRFVREGAGRSGNHDVTARSPRL